MKFMSMEDLTGTYEAVLFPKAYERLAPLTVTAGPFLLTGCVENPIRRASFPGGVSFSPWSTGVSPAPTGGARIPPRRYPIV
ncbi:MAG: hypothetical protein B1H03_00015 [Planctomycetales bacterium 4484_113]|nr:MAG: hypothetical protein B1H03_00015 [Planctomycetales bacterium 4484_113]